VALTSIKQGGEEMELGQDIACLEEIELDWRHNFFEFEFAALEYTRPRDNQYAYKLEGIDPDWYYAGNRRFGRYSNLPGGVYTLRLKAANNDGVWNEAGMSIKIRVSTPFWRTWWFYTLCALGVLGVFGVVYRVRTGQLKLEAENARMEAELDVTYRLQQMLLPTDEELAQLEGLDVAGFMQPAEEVGGDYYDVLRLGDQIKLGIGDVTGHGLESGVVMLMLQTAVRTLLIGGITDVAQFISILNRVLHANMQRMQVDKSTSLVMLNYEAGRMRLDVSGQHEHLIVVRQNGQVELLDTLDLGFPLGLEAEIDQFVSELSVELQPGDGIVLYSDGFTEAQNEGGDFYGLERLCKVVSQHWARLAKEIKEEIVRDVRDFIGGQIVYDDLALLVIKQQ
jgi:serine phosphatase RsbU (regulator of sigma subunit)